MPSTSESDATDAASGIGSRRSTSNVETEQRNVDVGVDEAYQSAALDQTRSWNANTKGGFDTLQEELHSTVKAAQTHLANVQTIQQQMLSNMVGNADALMKQHLAHSNIAADRTWNVDEVSAFTAKSGVEADAVVAMALKIIADASKD